MCDPVLHVHGQAVHEGGIECGEGSNVLQTQPEQRTHSCNKMMEKEIFFLGGGGDETVCYVTDDCVSVPLVDSASGCRKD